MQSVGAPWCSRGPCSWTVRGQYQLAQGSEAHMTAWNQPRAPRGTMHRLARSKDITWPREGCRLRAAGSLTAQAAEAGVGVTFSLPSLCAFTFLLSFPGVHDESRTPLGSGSLGLPPHALTPTLWVSQLPLTSSLPGSGPGSLAQAHRPTRKALLPCLASRWSPCPCPLAGTWIFPGPHAQALSPSLRGLCSGGTGRPHDHRQVTLFCAFFSRL